MDQTNDGASPSDMLSFRLGIEASRLSPRIGELIVRGYPAINTPALVASTSRGAIPHVTPDLVQKHTSIRAVYAGLEDFLEKSRQDAPILKIPDDKAVKDSLLRAYTGLSNQCVSILGPRRVPRMNTPHQSNNSALAISTSFGFTNLEVEDFNKAVSKLKPDVSTAIVDLVEEYRISRKRIERSADRTHAWLRDTLENRANIGLHLPLLASIPPLESQQQSFYLSDLSDEFKPNLSGICIYEPTTTTVIPDTLYRLPILCLSNPDGPHAILKAISLGIDLITTPFVTTTSEAGIALTFKFGGPQHAKPEALGIDMWSITYATDTSPLAASCTCYACSRHHKAYIRHLLQAKEMLAWTLLQIHNFHVVNEFFAAVRRSISNGSFDADHMIFRSAYEQEMPQKTGEGPRVRGYQIRSVGSGGQRKNAKKYNNLEEHARKVEEAAAGVATPPTDDTAEVLEEHGLGNKLGIDSSQQ